MKTITTAVTAANSKTMNAIESTKLFAAASKIGQAINFNGSEEKPQATGYNLDKSISGISAKRKQADRK